MDNFPFGVCSETAPLHMFCTTIRGSLQTLSIFYYFYFGRSCAHVKINVLDLSTLYRRKFQNKRKTQNINKVEKLRALERAEAWTREQARREARANNRLNREENHRLISAKTAERQVLKPHYFLLTKSSKATAVTRHAIHTNLKG